MVFVYDFHPAAETMMSRHFGSSPRKGDAAFGSQSGSVASTYRSAGLNFVLHSAVLSVSQASLGLEVSWQVVAVKRCNC